MATTNGWGLIGTGRIAEDRILPGINAYEGNKLIGVVSRDPARANDFARRFNAKHAYTNYDDLLKNPEVTVVAIHTPNALHAEQAIAAAEEAKAQFEAARMAVREMIDYLVTEKGMTRDDAYILTSLGVDLHVTQTVDETKGVHAMLPKSILH